jgi:hypothetical protein
LTVPLSVAEELVTLVAAFVMIIGPVVFVSNLKVTS